MTEEDLDPATIYLWAANGSGRATEAPDPWDDGWNYELIFRANISRYA